MILIGAPGVGKGTHTTRILKRYPQLSSLSSGDLLRENVRNKTALGKEAGALMERGELVPDNMILRLIRNALVSKGWLIPQNGRGTGHNDPSSDQQSEKDDEPIVNAAEAIDSDYDYSEEPSASFILDGFPRTAAQAVQLDNLIPINLAIHVHTPFEVIMDRITNRWVHAPSGRTYNTTFNPPKEKGRDDVTGEELVQRDDDKPDVWRSRLKQFEEQAKPLLKHYRDMGVLWRVEGGSSDEITPKIFKEFDGRFGVKNK